MGPARLREVFSLCDRLVICLMWNVLGQQGCQVDSSADT